MSLNRDGDGFLVNMNEWTPEVMKLMANEDGFELTEEAIKFIMSARDMYEEDNVVPAIRDFAKAHGMDRKAKELYDVFKTGPMKLIAKYGGLPKPTGCV